MDVPSVEEALLRGLDYAELTDGLLKGVGLHQDPTRREIAVAYAYAANMWANLAGVVSMLGMASHIEADHELAERQHAAREALVAQLTQPPPN